MARALCPNPDAMREVYAETRVRRQAQARAPAGRVRLRPHRPAADQAGDDARAPPQGLLPLLQAPRRGQAARRHETGLALRPGIVALVTYLHACQMVGYARLVEMLDGVFGLQISEGAIANMLARASSPLATEASRIAEIVRTSPVIASDETSARVCGKNHWQWTFLCASAVYHTIQPSRGKAVPVAFLGQAKPDVWVSDRLAAQGNHAAAHQYCLAHLMRDAQYAIEAGDRIFAPAFKRFLQDACAVGRRRERLADTTIKGHARRLQCELDRLLALKPTQAEGRHLREAMLLDARNKLLAFLDRRDVEPTNNASEQAPRPSVIFRKVTNGFRSAWGAKVHADICSVVATGRRARRTALAAIRDALARRPDIAAAAWHQVAPVALLLQFLGDEAIELAGPQMRRQLAPSFERGDGRLDLGGVAARCSLPCLAFAREGARCHRDKPSLAGLPFADPGKPGLRLRLADEKEHVAGAGRRCGERGGCALRHVVTVARICSILAVTLVSFRSACALRWTVSGLVSALWERR